jgi:hypothetical protein
MDGLQLTFRCTEWVAVSDLPAGVLSAGGLRRTSTYYFTLEKRMVSMDSRDDRMPEEPTRNLFLAAGSFGLLAAFVGSGLIVAAASF